MDDAAEAAHAAGELPHPEAKAETAKEATKPAEKPTEPAPKATETPKETPAEPKTAAVNKALTVHEATLEKHDPDTLAHNRARLESHEINNAEYARDVEAAAKRYPEAKTEDNPNAVQKPSAGENDVRRAPEDREGVRKQDSVDKGVSRESEAAGKAERDATDQEKGKPRAETKGEGNAPVQPAAKVDAGVLKPDDISKLDPEGFRKYADSLKDKGGFTNEAYRIGQAAKGDEGLAAKFKANKESAEVEMRAAMKGEPSRRCELVGVEGSVL